MLPVPDTLASPVTVRTPLAKLVPSAAPFNNTTDVGTKPLPVMVALKMPSGNCPFDPTPVITGMGGISVTVALALPFGRFENGLPRSLQILGPPGSEDAVLDLAGRLERVAPK